MIRILFFTFVIFAIWTTYHKEDKAPLNRNLQTITLPSFEELEKIPLDCLVADEIFTRLKLIQQAKNFDLDPDHLQENDRRYNARLKSMIWWYISRCKKS